LKQIKENAMSYKQLRTIEIKGYKSIKHQVIELSSMNVLIGQNGAGKSNFISVFKFLRNIIEGRLKNTSLKSGAENLLYYGSKSTKNIFLRLDFRPNVYDITLQPSEGGSLFITSEHVGFWGSGYASPYLEVVTMSEEESKLSRSLKNPKIADHVLGVLRDWRVYHFHDTSETAGVKKYGSMADSKFLFEDASNLAAFLYVLKNTEEQYYERIVKTIQLVIPFFKDFILLPNPINREDIRLEWCDNFSDKTFTANQLSDGSLRFICMATLLLQGKLPKVILLDEPELGLHPSAITVLAGLLKKASKRSQVIVSTQSVSLVNEFDAEDIVVVENKEAETVFKRLNAETLSAWLDNYSLGELWDKNVIGGKP
jgi:predicted ATPase